MKRYGYKAYQSVQRLFREYTYVNIFLILIPYNSQIQTSFKINSLTKNLSRLNIFAIYFLLKLIIFTVQIFFIRTFSLHSLFLFFIISFRSAPLNIELLASFPGYKLSICLLEFNRKSVETACYGKTFNSLLLIASSLLLIINTLR